MAPRKLTGSGNGPALTDAACAILLTPDPAEKARLSHETAAAWRSGILAATGSKRPPARPARPERPTLLPPASVPRRRINTALAGRIALLHAIAHIELNAIDLAWDILARFGSTADLPYAFYDDWVTVAAEEAKHFMLLCDRLAELDAAYGDLPAHDGLWEAAETTAHDLAARLAVVPLVLEARGLDVTPQMTARLRKAGDDASADILQVIHDEEIGHVAIGRRWFGHCCRAAGQDPVSTFHDLVRRHFRGSLKPPFNAASRDRAGLTADYYTPLAAGS